MTKLGKYQTFNPEKSSQAKARNVKIHFKNTRETAAAIKGMSLDRSVNYLKNVSLQKEIVPFVRYRYGVGRKAGLKKYKASNGRWPKKSSENILKIIKNAQANAIEKGLDTNSLYIKNIQINKAMKGHRRTFRAHGRVNSYSSHPCHLNLWLIQKMQSVPRES